MATKKVRRNLSEKELTYYEVKIEKEFYRHELLHYNIYSELAKTEKHPDLKKVLTNLAEKERDHIKIWEKELETHKVIPKKSLYSSLSLLGFRIIRSILGIAFMMKLLEGEEAGKLEKYEQLIGQQPTNINKKELLQMVKSEKASEDVLLSSLKKHQGKLAYIKSIIFGLNDGLVELFATVSGLAAFALGSSYIVAVAGVIVAISGTLSMAGGAYLAAKSENIVSSAMDRDSANSTSPLKEGYYTGIFYFFGSLVPILPFIFGFSGYLGIGISMLLTAIALIFASIVIGIIGQRSIPRRIAEMLGISFGAAIITIIIGTLARVYLGITI